MDRIISIIIRLIALNPKQTAQDTARSAMAMIAIATLALICGAITFAGFTVLLARGIGLVPALFSIAAVTLIAAMGLLVWLQFRLRTQRQHKRPQARARQAAVAGVLAALPRKRADRTMLVLAGIAALALQAGKSTPEAAAED